MKPLRLPALLLTAALHGGCGDATGVPLTGRWATEGLELRAHVRETVLTFPCGTTARLGPLRPDSGGRFELQGRATNRFGGFDLSLAGQVVRDTVRAEVTVSSPNEPPSAREYILVREGDAALGRFNCLQ